MAQPGKLYRIGTPPGDHDHARPQTPPDGLFRLGIRHPGAYVVRLWRAAIARSQQLIVRDIRLSYDGAHLVVVPAIGIIPRDDDGRLIPLGAAHEGVDRVHDKDLFVDRV